MEASCSHTFTARWETWSTVCSAEDGQEGRNKTYRLLLWTSILGNNFETKCSKIDFSCKKVNSPNSSSIKSLSLLEYREAVILISFFFPLEVIGDLRQYISVETLNLYYVSFLNLQRWELNDLKLSETFFHQKERNRSVWKYNSAFL